MRANERTARWLALIAGVGLATGCYSVRLQPVTGAGTGEPIQIPAAVAVPSDTIARQHSLHSALAGVANKWTIDVGHAVDEYARAYLGQAFPPGNDVTVRVDLVDYDVKGMAATTDLRFTVSDASRQLFQRDYRGVGKGRAGLVFLGGAFAMKSAMRSTTDDSLRSCFEQFLADARVEAPRWRREIAADRGDDTVASAAAAR